MVRPPRLVLVVLLGTLLIFFGLIGKLIVDQITQFIDQAPAKSQNLEHWINRNFGTHLTNKQISKEFNDPNGPIRGFATHLAGNALGFSLSALDVIFRFFTILLFTFYLVADGPRFRRLICSFMRPDRQREVLANWEVAIQKTGGYLYSRLLLGIIQAVFHYIAFVIIGIPYPLALALFVGVVSQFVPVVGTYIANGFPALIALAVDPVKAIWVVVLRRRLPADRELLHGPAHHGPDHVAAPGGGLRLGAGRGRAVRGHRRPDRPAGGRGGPGRGLHLLQPPRGGRVAHDRRAGATPPLVPAGFGPARGTRRARRRGLRRRSSLEAFDLIDGRRSAQGPTARRSQPPRGATMPFANPALNERVFDKEMGDDTQPGWASPTGGPTRRHRPRPPRRPPAPCAAARARPPASAVQPPAGTGGHRAASRRCRRSRPPAARS